jgi:uroporphyrinogen III methyltransferase / synthase
MAKRKGKVYLVGAGPGDPKLLTLRALEVIRRADLVIYDRLVDKAVIDMIPANVEKRYGGKERGSGGRKQSEINEMTLAEAKAGKKVVRLKGGDPFVFSRGGEEAEALREQGVGFEVVPGVTSALGVPAYAGIPATHRDIASTVSIVTGQEAGGKSSVRWARLAKDSDTLIVLMGASKVREIASRLLRGGMPPKTPAAAIERGTTGRQRTLFFTVGEAASGGLDGVEAPTVLVIGKTVLLASRLRWWPHDRVRYSPGYPRPRAR